MAESIILQVLLCAIAVKEALGNDLSAKALENRFSSTIDFMLDQLENRSMDAEILEFLPKRLKRGPLIRDDPHLCEDHIGADYCQYLKKHRTCIIRKERMAFLCNRTCGYCKPPPPECKFSEYGCCHDEQTPAKGKDFKGCEESCLDINGAVFCKDFQRMGFCEKRPEIGKRSCKKTCSFCRPCIDDISWQCKAIKFHGLCKKLKFIVLNKCRKTCDLCDDKDPCSSHTCPKDMKCEISSHGFPQCICKFLCHEGDTLTGRVCGRDGKEYEDLCALKQRNCNGVKVKAKSFGQCKMFDFMRGLSCRKTRDLGLCRIWKRLGYCIAMKDRIAKYCPHECGFCSAKASLPPCHYSKYGCCVDSTTPCQGPNYEGCLDKEKCKDKHPLLCRRFVAACGERANKIFMSKFCPVTCFLCSKRNEE
ncbi:follistatin-like [Rhopilema esculentum]|uniref:follistatin-like n=1 Tax=Rhopilema esculentum TaxID=499914 RepID=UPI0031E12546